MAPRKASLSGFSRCPSIAYRLIQKGSDWRVIVAQDACFAIIVLRLCLSLKPQNRLAAGMQLRDGCSRNTRSSSSVGRFGVYFICRRAGQIELL